MKTVIAKESTQQFPILWNGLSTDYLLIQGTEYNFEDKVADILLLNPAVEEVVTKSAEKDA